VLELIIVTTRLTNVGLSRAFRYGNSGGRKSKRSFGKKNNQEKHEGWQRRQETKIQHPYCSFTFAEYS
jgi:hypothetical protein